MEPIAVGFDIGGSITKLGIISSSGKILSSDTFPTDVESVGLQNFLQKFIYFLRNMLDRTDREVLGIGGTFLGWIDEDRSGPFLCFNSPELHGVNFRKILSAEFGLPVRLIDDTNAHAMAEYTYGSGRGYRRFMNLAIGTGLSAGIILDGEPLQFTGGCAGDTGHVLLRPGGPTCTAGCKGCAEALIGVQGVERLALEKYGQPRTARQVIASAREGNDTIAVEVITEVGGYIGELLASLSHIFLPERISLTGGTSTAGEVLLNAVRTRFEYLNGDYHRALSSHANDYYRGVDIVLGELKEATGLIGATVGFFSGRSTQNE